MGKQQFNWLIFLGALTIPSVADAAKGVVVLNKSSCRSRYVVETINGYAILEWYGGKDPLEGEQIYGDFETFGMKDVTFGDGSSGKVWVEDFWLSSSRVLEKMKKFCNR